MALSAWRYLGARGYPCRKIAWQAGGTEPKNTVHGSVGPQEAWRAHPVMPVRRCARQGASRGRRPIVDGEAPHEMAARIADQIAPLLRQARGQRLDFLAYCLGMALKKARRLSEQQNGG